MVAAVGRARQPHRRHPQIRACPSWPSSAWPTAPRPDLRPGRRRPGAVIPELPRNARSPIAAAPDPHPAAAQLVRSRQGVVGEEGPVADRGEAGQRQHRGDLGATADLHAQRRSHSGVIEPRVQREQRLPGRVHQLAHRPGLPADPAVQRMPARAQPEAQQPDGAHQQQRVRAARRPAWRAPARAARRAAPRRDPRPRVRSGAPPRVRARRERRQREQGRAPDAARTSAAHRDGRGGRCFGQSRFGLAQLHGGRAAPALTGRHLAGHARIRGPPGPACRPGHRGTAGCGCRPPRPPPTFTGTDHQPVAVQPVPDRSTSASTAQPRPSLSMPVTGGSECRSTSAPIRAPSARRVPHQPRPGQRGRAADSASRSAVHSRRWTWPPRG